MTPPVFQFHRIPGLRPAHILAFAIAAVLVTAYAVPAAFRAARRRAALRRLDAEADAYLAWLMETPPAEEERQP